MFTITNTYTHAKITPHNNGFSKIAQANGMRPYDGGITGEWYSHLRWGDYGRMVFAPTSDLASIPTIAIQ
jgi:hypothetical protein